MKKFIGFLSFLLMSCVFSTIAQTNSDEPLEGFLFPQFEDAIVILKKGPAKLSAKLNYDLLDKRMVYLEEDGSVFELVADVTSYITINGRSFVPVGGSVFYERITLDDNEYYIDHKVRVLSKGKETGYGTRSQSAAVTGFAVSTHFGRSYQFTPEEWMEAIDESVIFIKTGEKKYQEVKSLKNLTKLFKSHQAELEAYSKSNKIDFRKLDEAKKIVEYALSLK